MDFYKKLIRPLLFKMDPENAHRLAVDALKNFGPLFPKSLVYKNSVLRKTVLGTELENPIGLAAGFDKNGELLQSIGRLGFGFIEIGSVTLAECAGNFRPRVFRLPRDSAIINRMGLNGRGARNISRNLQFYFDDVEESIRHLPVAVNIAPPNKFRPLSNEEVQKYVVSCFQDFSARSYFPRLFYIAINISCPNTADGVNGDAESVIQLAEALQKENKFNVPILFKLSSDSPQHFICRVVQKANVQGFICGNTTTARSFVHDYNVVQITQHLVDPELAAQIGPGGLSGAPLFRKNLELCKLVNKHKNRDQVIIGVGGIDCAEHVDSFERAGASLVQLYTGLVYEGPALPAQINRNLAARFRG